MKKIITAVTIPLLLIFCYYFFFPGLLYNNIFTIGRCMAGLDNKQCSMGNDVMHYLEGGQGETIVLVHGFTGDKDNWLMLAKHLTPDYHVISIDNGGFGDSSYDESTSYTISWQAERLKTFMDKKNITSCHIAGNSMGGAIAGMFTCKYPKRVKSLALLDSAGVVSPVKSEYMKLLEKGENRLIVKSREDYDYKINFIFNKPPFLPERLKNHRADLEIKRADRFSKIFNDMIKDILTVESCLSKIKCPSLILWGREDRIIDYSASGVFNTNIKNSRQVTIKKCGHVPMVEKPDKTAEAYLAFLKDSRRE